MCSSRNIVARSRNHFCRGIKISIIYFECVSVALFSWCAMRMRCIILLPLACLVPQYFYTSSHKSHDFFGGGGVGGGGGGEVT